MNPLVLVLVASALALMSVPLVVASHKLVPNLKDEVAGPKGHSPVHATNMLKKLVTECSSDEYLLINLPGLLFSDLNMAHADAWPSLRKYMMMASSLVGLPRVEEPVDLDYLENYIVRTCDAETINVDHEDEHEVNAYIDTRKRVIRVELDALPDDDTRGYELRKHDELLRQILRKLPSPHYTIILTSDTPTFSHPAPKVAIEKNPDKYDIFSDIVNHPSRAVDVERNDRFRRPEIQDVPKKETLQRYLRNRRRDEIHLFDNDIWQKNERLVATVVMMVASLFVLQLTRSARAFQNWAIAKLKRRHEPVLGKKVD